jgi:hypothetical protein
MHMLVRVKYVLYFKKPNVESSNSLATSVGTIPNGIYLLSSFNIVEGQDVGLKLWKR